MTNIEHRPEVNRFSLFIEGDEAYVEYELKDESMVILHTLVPDSMRGKGIAGKLMEHCYAYCQEHHLTFVPVCSYAQSWLKAHKPA